MEGHEASNWELFNKELVQKQERATPLRRYQKDAISRLTQKTQEKPGIKNHREYKKFVGELEEMMDYFVQMEYSHLNIESGDPLWRFMSAELKRSHKRGQIWKSRKPTYTSMESITISEAKEQMEGHEASNWELFNKELVQKQERATPLRRYQKDAISRLTQKTQEKPGIKNHREYKKFVGELEEMMDYFVQMEYSHLNIESGDPLWRFMSAELKRSHKRVSACQETQEN
ncbi:hypothetical protein PSTG_00849 [Puccinia striiformis f. sp. tritici PST-78]|uniref:Uncharacterized protein n=1 Tax=Puccinia striiformis f. sp. tritici PST-78 TaxID=1165861 RepID=A0A0L0W3J0_9BASI|nr:hypothetical protein PSTG_00849 [Puccinia striiformis f. sp. tritici PST-78]